MTIAQGTNQTQATRLSRSWPRAKPWLIQQRNWYRLDLNVARAGRVPQRKSRSHPPFESLSYVAVNNSISVETVGE